MYILAFLLFGTTMLISLSILDYEPDLAGHVGNISESKAMAIILSLIQTGKIHRVHMDVMRPPMIPNRTAFQVELIRALHQSLNGKIPLAAHLMVDNPYPIIDKMNTFIPKKERSNFAVFIQRESFSSNVDAINALNFLKDCNYLSGICLNLPTSTEALTADIIEVADMILLMTVPMGAGGQEYSEEGTRRITHFSQMFPNKTIEVDGGINSKTIVKAEKAGAKTAVVGSFITSNEDPTEAIAELEQSLRCSRD
jgi:ribulose-phosphate 3-epimerase